MNIEKISKADVPSLSSYEPLYEAICTLKPDEAIKLAPCPGKHRKGGASCSLVQSIISAHAHGRIPQTNRRHAGDAIYITLRED